MCVHTIGVNSPADPVRAGKYGYNVDVLVCSFSTFSTVRKVVAPVRLPVSISSSGCFDGWLTTNSVELLTLSVSSSFGRSSSRLLFGETLVAF